MEDTNAETTNARLFLNQVDDLYKGLGYTNAAVILIASFLAWILWPVATSHGLAPWYSCILLLNLWHIALSLLYRRAHVDSEAKARGWLRLYIVGVFLAGLCWGFLLLFVVPPSATVHLLAAAFIVAGLVTGSAASLASLKFGFAMFSVPAILPGAIYLIYLNKPVTFIIGVSLISFLVFILFIALRIHKTLYYSLRKQMEVSSKLSQLESEKAELAYKLELLEYQTQQDQIELDQLRNALRHKSLPGASVRRANEFRDLRFISLLDKLTGGVWDLNMKTGELALSPGWLAMLGYEEDATTSTLEFWSGILHPEDRLAVLNKLHAFAEGQLPEFSSSHRLRAYNGDWVWVMARAHGVVWGSFGELLNIAGMELHVPESGDAAGKSLQLLNFDINAWLVNQQDFDKRFGQLVATAALEGIEHTLCYFRIIPIDDDEGRSGSLDEIRLYEVGRVLLNEFRHGDALLRLGNDAFALLLAFCRPEDARDKALTLQATLAGLKVQYKGRRLGLATGIGITPINATAGDAAMIMDKAKAACELAISCSNTLVYLHESASKFHLELTPLNALGDGRGEGEQLFMAAAVIEGMQDAISIDTFAVGKLVERLLQAAPEPGARRVYCYECASESCNDERFLRVVQQQLARLGSQHGTLCLGVPTPHDAHAEATLHFMRAVRSAGGRIALTRFGNPAQVASLTQGAPVDYLKFEATLLENLDENPSHSLTIRYINDMIHLAGVKSIAASTAAASATELREMHVDFVQRQ